MCPGCRWGDACRWPATGDACKDGSGSRRIDRLLDVAMVVRRRLSRVCAPGLAGMYKGSAYPPLPPDHTGTDVCSLRLPRSAPAWKPFLQSSWHDSLGSSVVSM